MTPEARRKASATKLAKRITVTCVECGYQWKEKPSRARVTCSQKCRVEHLRKERPDKSCSECGNRFSIKASTQKTFTCGEECSRKRHARLMKERGHKPVKDHRWLAVMKSDKYKAEQSKALSGVVHLSEGGKRFSRKHPKAVEMFVRSPAGVVYYVFNIRRFVNEHPHLFDSGDTVWHTLKSGLPAGCRAANGLASLHRTVNTRLSWKGWTRVSNRQGAEDAHGLTPEQAAASIRTHFGERLSALAY